MSHTDRWHIGDGFAEHHRDVAASFFWDAFKGKLGGILGPDEQAVRYVARSFDPAFAICATGHDDNLLGIAGYKTARGGLLPLDIAALLPIYGLLGAAWRAALLRLLTRRVQPGVLLMDGLFVGGSARGAGVGSALLSAIKVKAGVLGCTHVRLDVIDSNPRARALYEREGFVAERRIDVGPLRHIFGFRSATTMMFTV